MIFLLSPSPSICISQDSTREAEPPGDNILGDLLGGTAYAIVGTG